VTESAVPRFHKPGLPPAGRCVLGLIAAGPLVCGGLVGALRARADPAVLVSHGGRGAVGAAVAYGFPTAETDPVTVLAHPGINAVLVAGGGRATGPMAARAVRAGKAVLAEPPLVAEEAHLETLEAAVAAGPGFLVPALPGRFGREAGRAARRVRRAGGARVVSVRAPAGRLGAMTLVRLLDLALYLADAAPATVRATPTRRGLTTVVELAGGGRILCALGGAPDGPARLEAMTPARTVTLDGAPVMAETEGTARWDAGTRALAAGFTRAAATGAPPLSAAAALAATRVALAARRGGGRLDTSNTETQAMPHPPVPGPEARP